MHQSRHRVRFKEISSRTVLDGRTSGISTLMPALRLATVLCFNEFHLLTELRQANFNESLVFYYQTKFTTKVLAVTVRTCFAHITAHMIWRILRFSLVWSESYHRGIGFGLGEAVADAEHRHEDEGSEGSGRGPCGGFRRGRVRTFFARVVTFTSWKNFQI